ncbi:MAG TPA: hypothetical protein VF623_12245 [Segetibacter sp.]|jgi:hypothetical protein
MPQVTLSVPQQKLPLLKDVLNAIGIENRNIAEKSSKNFYRTRVNNLRNSANSIYHKYFGWEYFSNDLEFE